KIKSTVAQASPRPAQIAPSERPASIERASAPQLPPSPPAAVEEPPLILNPRYRRPPSPPAYPAPAIRLEQQGTVLVQARISTAGDAIEVRVHQSSGHSLLDDAALAAVRRWAFVPATRNGVPIESWVRAPVNFVLTANQRSFP
ncbi:MAG: energy transducer TonB, partial [Candidatus Contendobacter sp.]|nr:energy transducer TonB [Candidatus Contendobacter sp.]